MSSIYETIAAALGVGGGVGGLTGWLAARAKARASVQVAEVVHDERVSRMLLDRIEALEHRLDDRDNKIDELQLMATETAARHETEMGILRGQARECEERYQALETKLASVEREQTRIRRSTPSLARPAAKRWTSDGGYAATDVAPEKVR